MFKPHAFEGVVGAAVVAALCSLGCSVEAVPEGESGSVSLAVDDDRPDPNEGKTCYLDGPMKKGKMEMGLCCVDDPIKGTSHCYTCDAANECTIGDAKPGALVSGGFTGGGFTGGSGGVRGFAVTGATGTFVLSKP